MRLTLALAAVAFVCGCLCCSWGGEGAGTAVRGLSPTTTHPQAAGVSSAGYGTAAGNLTDISEAFRSNQPYLCTFMNQRRLGEVWRSRLWVKGERYHCRIDMGRQRILHVMCDGVWVYSWPEGTHGMGSKYRIGDTKGIGGEVDSAEIRANKSAFILTDFMNFITAEEVNCVPSDIPASLFTPPSNVRFRSDRLVYDYEYDSEADRLEANKT